MNLQEDFCSQELYNLLIEKGFEVSSYDVPFTYRLVTHQSAMKWLRERHVIIVIAPAYFNREQCVSWDIDIWIDGNYEHPFEDYPTYKEAVEAAIKYCLINSIEK